MGGRSTVPARPETPSPAATIDDTHLGRNFGGYELVNKIGQGGMGVVYKGRQVSLDRVVAIKILSKALCDNDEFIRRFEREAKSIARISHPNIVAVYDFGKTDGLWFMVTEFIEGSNLARMITEQLVMQVENVLPLMVQCLAGLAHVSQSGIIHRDIKPDNILLTKEQIAKIADFGLAKDVTNDTDLTAVGLAMGTPSYMSPEQCMGRRLDVRSDVYSLGVTAYFALTGEKPFTGQSSFEIMTKQREHMPPPPVQLNPRLPKDVSALIMRMIAKNPHDRFPDAGQCREAWIQLGQEMGLMGPVTRSGEYRFPLGDTGNKPPGKAVSANAGKPAGLGDLLPPTLPPVPSQPPAAASGLPPLPLPPAASHAPSNLLPEVSAPSTGQVDRRTSSEQRAPPEGQDGKSGTERPTRPITERKLSSRINSNEAVTCQRCGMLNRGDVRACQRCGHRLHEGDEPTLKEQEAEANRLFETGSYHDAALMFARLADKETERRQRSILRSKEREARRLEQEQQVNEINARSTALLERGDIMGGIEVIERGLQGLSGEVGKSGAANELSELLAQLRQRLRSRRRMKVVLVVLVVAIAIGAGVAWKMGVFAAPAGAAPTSEPDAAGTGA